MKHLIFVLLAVFLTFNANAGHENWIPEFGSDEVITASEVHIPSGFDSDSDAFIIVSALLRNSCYKWKGVTIDHNDRYTHSIRLVANVDDGGVCMMVVEPISQEIRLGQLDPGEHIIRLDNGDGTYFEKTLVIEES